MESETTLDKDFHFLPGSLLFKRSILGIQPLCYKEAQGSWRGTEKKNVFPNLLVQIKQKQLVPTTASPMYSFRSKIHFVDEIAKLRRTQFLPARSTTSVFWGYFFFSDPMLSDCKAKLQSHSFDVRLSPGRVPMLRDTGPKRPSIPLSPRPQAKLDLEARVPIPLGAQPHCHGQSLSCSLRALTHSIHTRTLCVQDSLFTQE